MEKLVINGGKKLKGDVYVSGAKNAALAIIPAALLSDEPCEIENLPMIQDLLLLRDILTHLGAKAEFIRKGVMRIDPNGLRSGVASDRIVSRMRASYYLLGCLLSRFNNVEIALPGGCDIGSRPIDQHIKGLQAMGANITVQGGKVIAHTSGLVGTEIYLDVVSVGATINIMLAAVKAHGVTTIVNAAKEPHVVDCANFLNRMGASVKGAGTDTIRVVGQTKLHGCSYSVIADQIEAGTLMIAAAATKGDVYIRNVIPTHLESLSAKLMETGVHIEEGDDYVHIIGNGDFKPVTIKTFPYPGFPTDLQQPITALLVLAKGTSVVIENIFEDRFKHVHELCLMGAKIQTTGNVAVIEGVDKISGASVKASDLRAGAALVVAGLIAEGTTEIYNVKYIDRGYEQLEEKLLSLGADIQRVSCPPSTCDEEYNN
ncbi:MAG: UDP-N-acetylglucosamine 1-carboxyvinyltransferase [Christensenellales bacterium]